MSVSKALLSSNSDEWATPIYIYIYLDEEFHFTLDACATEENHKPRSIQKECVSGDIPDV